MRRVSSSEITTAVDAVTQAALLAAGVTTQAEAAEVIDAVLEVARAWHRGALPLAEAARLHTPPERFLAGRFIRPQPVPLKAYFAALVAAEDVLLDRRGQVYDVTELAGVRHRIVYRETAEGPRLRTVVFEATPAELERVRPGGASQRAPSTAARQAAWRTGLPRGDH